MSKYIIKIGEELNFVLQNACSAQPEQFAGYCANVDFWFSEVEHLIDLVEGYDERFARMKEARNRYLKEGNRRPQNADESGSLYQTPRQTTSSSDRTEVAQEARRNIKRFLGRGMELGCIDPDLHDCLVEKISPPKEQYRSI